MRVDVRGLNRNVHQELRKSIQRRLWFVLGRFGSRIRRVTVTVDLAAQASAGRTTNRCRITVSLGRAGSLHTEDTGTDVAALVERAAHQVGQLVRREIDRQREISKRSPSAASSAKETYPRDLPHLQH